MYQKSGGTLYTEVCKGCKYYVKSMNTNPNNKFGKMRTVECLLFKAKLGGECIDWDGEWTACKWYEERTFIKEEESPKTEKKRRKRKSPVISFKAEEDGQLSFI